MTFGEFQSSLEKATPPTNLPPLLEALWYDAHGDWDQAHNIAQDIHSDDGSWIHAYLHRKEGDLGNASYWYNRANRPAANGSLQEEWEQIARALLANSEPRQGGI